MTSLRERLKTKSFTERDLAFFKENKGSVPLCCTQIIKVNSKMGIPKGLWKCDQLEEGISETEFRAFCLKCQKEIENILRKMRLDEGT